MMTALSFAILVSTSAGNMDSETNRVAYNNCLVDFTISHLEQKTGLSAFRKASKEACVVERDALIAAIRKDELEFGSTAKEANDYAVEEAGNVRVAYTDGYTSYLNSNSQPVKE